MTRLAIAAAVLAATTALASSGTYSAFTQTQQNTAIVQTQAVFPPLNSVAPTVTPVTTLGVTTGLIGGRGTWTTADAATTTYTLQWQREDAGVWGDVGSSLVLTSGTLGGTLTRTLDTVNDAGKQLRLEVTAVNSAISSGRSTTVAYSGEVTG